MLRIGDFSTLSKISIHMLRHYDKLDLLVPVHVDHETGYSLKRRFVRFEVMRTASHIVLK